jgi:general secretion pathway protein G
MSRRRHSRQGFTLIEVLLVLAILVILGSLAVGMFTNTQSKANIRAAKSQIGLFDTPIQEYHLDLNQFPSTLEALVAAPGDLANPAKWGGPYLKDKTVPLDPWGSPYQYVAPGANNPNMYDLWSLGPDKASGTDDDITNWSE